MDAVEEALSASMVESVSALSPSPVWLDVSNRHVLFSHLSHFHSEFRLYEPARFEPNAEEGE